MRKQIHNVWNTKKAFLKSFLIVFCVFASLFHEPSAAAFAQQDPQYSQYMFNQLAINPAYAGSKEAISTAIFLRSQWTGMDGAPTTQTLTVHGPTRKKKVALGLTIVGDQVGPKNSIGVLGTYAYRIKLGKGKLSMGLRAGAYQFIFDWNKVKYKDPDIYNQNSLTSITVLTADAGAYYYTNDLYAGFSVTHLNNGRLTTVSNQNGEDAQLSPHLFFTAGKAFVISDKLIFSPSCMVKAVKNTPVTGDLNLSFLIQKRLWVGVSGRSSYGIVGYTQFCITDKFKIGYAYDFGMNKIGTRSGSHELMLSYDFMVSKPPFASPRYF